MPPSFPGEAHVQRGVQGGPRPPGRLLAVSLRSSPGARICVEPLPRHDETLRTLGSIHDDEACQGATAETTSWTIRSTSGAPTRRYAISHDSKSERRMRIFPPTRK